MHLAHDICSVHCNAVLHITYHEDLTKTTKRYRPEKIFKCGVFSVCSLSIYRDRFWSEVFYSGEFLLCVSGTSRPSTEYHHHTYYCIHTLGSLICIWFELKPHKGWRGGAKGKAFGLAINRSQVQLLLEVTLRNILWQVVYTYVPLSPSSITWSPPNSSDAVRLGR